MQRSKEQVIAVNFVASTMQHASMLCCISAELKHRIFECYKIETDNKYMRKFSEKNFREFSSCNYYLFHFHSVGWLAGSLNI